MANRIEDLTNEELIAQHAASQEAPSDLQSLSDEELINLHQESVAVDQHKEAVEGVSIADTIVTQGAQGMLAGHFDEFHGVVQAGIRKIQGDETPFSEIYSQERDLMRDDLALQEEAHPVTSFASIAVGSIAPAILSGGGSIPALGSTAGFRAAAVLGGLSGVGFSNATGKELIADAAIGTALGVAGEAVFKGVGQGIGKLLRKTPKATVKVLEDIGNTRHANNVSFETSIYKRALTDNFKDMDSFLVTKEAQKTAAVWQQNAPEIPKDLLLGRKVNATSRLKAIIASPENQNNKVVISDIVDEMLSGETGVKQFRGAGDQKQAVSTFMSEIIEPLQSGELRLANKRVDPNNLEFDQAIEFKRLVSELTFRNTDPQLDTAKQFAFRKAPAVSKRLEKFAGEIIERTNQADRTGMLKSVNENLFNIMQAEQLAPKNIQYLQALTKNYGDDAAFISGQEFLLALDKVDDTIKRELSQEIVPGLELVGAVKAASIWNIGVSTLFQAKAATAAVGPAGAVIALGSGGTLLAAQAIGKAAKLAFKVPRDVFGIMQNANIIVQKLADVRPSMAIQLNDLLKDKDVAGIKEFAKGLLQDPAMAAEFEEGIGFEGEITNPEELEMVQNQIMTSQVPLADKIAGVNQLNESGKIPEVPQYESVVPPEVQELRLERKASKQSLNLVKKVEKDLGE